MVKVLSLNVGSWNQVGVRASGDNALFNRGASGGAVGALGVVRADKRSVVLVKHCEVHASIAEHGLNNGEVGLVTVCGELHVVL